MKRITIFGTALTILISFISVACVTQRNVASAQEYFDLGSAYLELGKYEEAEKWFVKAAKIDQTKTASKYNLGRIAFETKKYEEAAQLFEALLNKDLDNVMVLKAASFARLKNGNLELAEKYYQRVVELAPESVDSKYNYALILYEVEKYEEAMDILTKLHDETPDDRDAFILLARSQGALGKDEAMDSYTSLLEEKEEAQLLLEYAETAESLLFYARAVEAYTRLNQGGLASQAGLENTTVQYKLARIRLIADPEDTEALDILKEAVESGFDDTEELTFLSMDERLSPSVREEISSILAKEEEDESPEESENPETETESETDTSLEGDGS